MQLRHTTQGRTTQHKQAKYPNISQPKLDKFQLQCYSKCSKWRPKFDHGRWKWNPCLHESVVCYQAYAAHVYMVCILRAIKNWRVPRLVY